jgi:hypothetical protein
MNALLDGCDHCRDVAGRGKPAAAPAGTEMAPAGTEMGE